jgi:hypothetical protein
VAPDDEGESSENLMTYAIHNHLFSARSEVKQYFSYSAAEMTTIYYMDSNKNNMLFALCTRG